MKYPKIHINPMTAVLTAVAVAATYVLARAVRARVDDEHRESTIDHTLEDSFPASDPPSF